ncbi:MAG: hypothetical protein JO022_09220 [Acidobacteriaceae bacterium]|nr:hypothetical protein [Acidobacteriaceae bacterium]
MYVVAETYENSAPLFRLHALDLSTGREKMNGPVTIQASVAGDGDGSLNGEITLDTTQHLQRPGLLLANGAVYIAFGSVRDRFPYHGWIVAFNASDITKQKAVFNDTPDGGNGGVWQSGRGLAADGAGNVYAISGNGDYDGFLNFGESVIKLTPDLRVIDWFAPADWQDMSDVDLDLGSLGPVLVPGTDLVIGGDKADNLYVVNGGNMGHLGTSDAANPQVFQPITGGGVFNVALWPRTADSLLYIVEEGDWTGGFRLANGTMESSAFSQTTVTSDWPFQGMAISANGNNNGILWMTIGDHDFPDPPGALLAYDALDLTHLLWSSEMNGRRDRLGTFAKFANPTVANGRVFVPTFSNALVVYGLLPPARGACLPAPGRVAR